MNNRVLPSKGFVLLLFVATSMVAIVFWALALTSAESESLGHRYFAEKNYQGAAEMFVDAGNKFNSPRDRSRCYRGAASAYYVLGDYGLSLNKLKMALKYNGKNEAAYNILSNISSAGIYSDYESLIETIKGIYHLDGIEQSKVIDALRRAMLVIPAQELQKIMPALGAQIMESLLMKDSIQYIGQYGDGWSIGKHAGVLISNKDRSHDVVVLQLKTAFPRDYYPVTVIVNVNNTSQKVILSDTSANRVALNLQAGVNTIWLSIDKSFTPSKVSSSKDYRDLGVNYRIINMRDTSL